MVLTSSTPLVIEAQEELGSRPGPNPVPVPFRVRLMGSLIRRLLRPYARAVAEQIRLPRRKIAVRASAGW